MVHRYLQDLSLNKNETQKSKIFYKFSFCAININTCSGSEFFSM